LHQSQKGKLQEEKVRLFLFRRIVKKSMRNQPNVRHESAPASVVSDKKARREARKMEVKQQKKAEKQKKRENKMDEEEK
jgi:hypothetical protein